MAKTAMKKTEYVMQTSWGMGKGHIKYRVVWEKDGEYFVKEDGRVWNVTHAKDEFENRNYITWK